MNLPYIPHEGIAITPSDTTVLAPPLHGFISDGGDVTVRFADTKATALYPSTAAGGLYSAYIDQVLATGTTALRITGVRL